MQGRAAKQVGMGEIVDPPLSSLKEVKSFLEEKNNPISHFTHFRTAVRGRLQLSKLYGSGATVSLLMEAVGGPSLWLRVMILVLLLRLLILLSGQTPTTDVVIFTAARQLQH
ncbi:hypothetical protein NQZ68_028030 [Dissostichus eleginoides]|nr:hypothetical protein NQZ68_028030 [Dissostichus eleginoides]